MTDTRTFSEAETDLVRKTLSASRALLVMLSDQFDTPLDAYVALVLTLASLSHSMDIDLDHTLAGVARAYQDLQNKKGTMQ